MHEKLLGEDVDDLVRAGVKEPVVLAGEEKGVEHHEGPVEVQGGKAADEEEGAPQPRPGPEAGAPAGRLPPRRQTKRSITSAAADTHSAFRSKRKSLRTSAKWLFPSSDQAIPPAEKVSPPVQ